MSSRLLAVIFMALGYVYSDNFPVYATHKEVNGCGSGVTGLVTPNTPAGVSFEPACNNHDRCYGIIGKSRDACDNTFHNEMLTVCREKYPDGKFLGKSIRKPQRIACNGAADTYFKAVREKGGSAYKQAQDHARKG